MIGVDESTELGLRVARWPEPDVAGAPGHRLHDLVVDRPLDEEPRSRGAALPVEAEDLKRGRAKRRLDIGIGEDHERRLAPELHRELLQVRRRVSRDDLAGSRL